MHLLTIVSIYRRTTVSKPLIKCLGVFSDNTIGGSDGPGPEAFDMQCKDAIDDGWRLVTDDDRQRKFRRGDASLELALLHAPTATITIAPRR